MGNLLKNIVNWLHSQGIFAIFIIFLVMILNFGFGIYHLAKQAVVDEPLWTFDRIPRYWKNISELDWKGTNISDKPGITVALFSGIGLLKENPKEYEFIHWKGDIYISDKNIEKMNFALRFPIFLFSVLMLPAFYFLIERLLGKNTALFSIIFIGLSSILLGISRIINPDSLIWIFLSFSVLSYLNFIKNRNKWLLFLTGILFGLALLTKYISNILFIYFLGVIFLDYVYNQEKMGDFRKYIKNSLLDLAKIAIIALAFFSALFPAVWIKPKKLLTATIFSEAFSSSWPYFAGVIVLVLLDYFIFKSKGLGKILSFLKDRKHLLTRLILMTFLVFILATMINVYSGMRFFDFEQILASPKSSSSFSSAPGVLLANFYSLIFGLHPMILFFIILAVIFALIKKYRDNQTRKAAMLILIFIFLYYAGSIFNNVALTVRYQISLYPFALILAAIGANYILELLSKKYAKEKLILAGQLLMIIILTITLYQIKPFYFSYASDLFPQSYVLNLKDMGDGSYEAAEYLNALPDAKNLSIWTDKRGVCVFFKGHCTSTLDFKRYISEGIKFDYYVVSKGREARTTKLVNQKIGYNSPYIIRFDKLYQLKNINHQINLAGRMENYIKIIKADRIDIYSN